MWDETHCMTGNDTEDMYLQLPVKYSLPSCAIHVATNFLQPVFLQKYLLVLVISLRSNFHSCRLLKPCPLVLASSHVSAVCVSPCTSPCHYSQCLAVNCLFCISISEVAVEGCVFFAFTWDYQVIVIISKNFLFKSVYCCVLPSLSLGYSFHSLWSNCMYRIFIKTYISSSQ